MKRSPSALQIELAQTIATKIRDGLLLPGHHLVEQALSREYEVSRTPVRVALQILAEQGLLVLEPNSGAYVAPVKQWQKPQSLGAPAGVLPEEQLYRRLLADRATGKLGSNFTESEVLLAYQATRGVLNRVLARLARERLIERRKGHGWNFRPMLDSAESLLESYRFRILVECGALREETFNAAPDVLAQSRKTHEGFLQRHADTVEPFEFFEMNAAFHEMLASFSGNQFIHQAVQQQNQLRRFAEYANFLKRSLDVQASCLDHLQIIEALERGDRDWGVALLQRHLTIASRSDTVEYGPRAL